LRSGESWINGRVRCTGRGARDLFGAERAAGLVLFAREGARVVLGAGRVERVERVGVFAKRAS